MNIKLTVGQKTIGVNKIKGIVNLMQPIAM